MFFFDDERFTIKAQDRIKTFNEELSLFQQVTALRSYSAVADRAADTLERWQKTEAEKQSRLRKMGYEKEMSAPDINDEITRIRAAQLPSDLEKKIEDLAKKGLLAEYQKLEGHISYLLDKGQAPEAREQERLGVLRRGLQNRIGDDWEKAVAAYRKISNLVGCSPKPLDNRLQAYFDRYGINPFTAKPSELEAVRQRLKSDLSVLENSEKFTNLAKKLNLALPINDRDLYQIIEDYTVAVSALRLAALTPRLIVFNRLSEDVPESLNSAIEKLLKHFKNSQTSIEVQRINEIVGALSVSVRQTDLIFIFTDNPLVGLTIGRYPPGGQSCQKYWYGSETLAAYPADAMTKICLLIDKNKLLSEIVALLDVASTEAEKLNIFNRYTHLFLDGIIARRVTKIVKDNETKEPLVFLEPATYTAYDKVQMAKILNTCAREVIQKQTGLSLRRGGGSLTVEVAGSRNTEQYEDGECGGPDNGGLGNKQGSYTMPSQTLSESDYLPA